MFDFKLRSIEQASISIMLQNETLNRTALKLRGEALIITGAASGIMIAILTDNDM